MEQLETPVDVLAVAIAGADAKNEEEEEEHDTEGNEDKPKHLGTKMGMDFEKVGGLDDQLNAIVRRVLASRYESKTNS
jgi:hypothetical protein